MKQLIKDYQPQQNRDLTDGKYRRWIIPTHSKYAADTNGNIYRYGLTEIDTFPFIGEVYEPVRPYVNKEKYLMVHLREHGHQGTYQVAKLMVEAFKENPKKYTQVDHINCDNTDNRLSNLRHVSPRIQALNKSNNVQNPFVHKNGRGWSVNITINGTQKNFGYFKNKNSAIRRRDEALKIYGIEL